MLATNDRSGNAHPPPPAGSPGLLADRVYTACEICRRRKRKCDGKRPCCSPCEIRGTSCSWEPRRKPFSNRDRDKSYVKSLEDQVRQLSALVGESSDSLALCASEWPTEGSLVQEDDVMTREYPNRKHFRPGFARSARAVGEFASLNWNYPDCPGAENALFSGPGSFSILGRAVLERLTGSARPQEMSAPEVDMLIEDFGRQQGLKDSLKHFFLESINKYYRFVEPHWLTSMHIFPQNGAVLQLLYSAIFAVSAHCLHVAIDLESALLANAERLVPSCYKTDDCLPVIRAVSILGWLKHTLLQHSDGFTYQYMASGLSAQLQLHKKPSTIPPTGNEPNLPLDYMDSVRTFWSLFLVERTSTPGLGVPLAVPWDIFQVPVFVDVFMGPDDPFLSFQHHCHLLQLNHLYVDTVYTPAFRLLSAADQDIHLQKATRALAAFQQDMNSRIVIRKDSTLAADKAVVWISYHAALVNLHRPFLNISSEYKASNPSTSLTAVTTAAEAIAELLDLLDTNRDVETLPPFVIYHILRAALVHCLNMTSSDVQLKCKASQSLQVCLGSLCAIRKIWAVPVNACVSFLISIAQSWGLQITSMICY